MTEKEKSEEELDKIFRSNICAIAYHKLEESTKKWMLPDVNYDISIKELESLVSLYNIVTNDILCGDFSEQEHQKRKGSYYI